LPIRNCPLIFFRPEFWHLLDSLFSFSGLLTISWFCLHHWLSGLSELLILDVRLIDLLWLIGELETNDGLDTTDVSFDIEELIHESQL
jgi:hypothetical protein